MVENQLSLSRYSSETVSSTTKPAVFSSMGYRSAMLVQHGSSGYKLNCKGNPWGRGPAHRQEDTELKPRHLNNHMGLCHQQMCPYVFECLHYFSV